MWTKSYINCHCVWWRGQKKSQKAFPFKNLGCALRLPAAMVHRLSFCVKWISREFLQCYNTTSSTIVKYNYRTGGSYCWSLMTKYVLTWKTSVKVTLAMKHLIWFAISKGSCFIYWTCLNKKFWKISSAIQFMKNLKIQVWNKHFVAKPHS